MYSLTLITMIILALAALAVLVFFILLLRAVFGKSDTDVEELNLNMSKEEVERCLKEKEGEGSSRN